MMRIAFPAMGTTVDVTADSDRGIAAVRQLFEDVEAECSRFLPGSELTRINEDTRTHVTVSPRMARVLHAADHARSITDGIVDAGIGSAVLAWGYDRTFAAVAGLDDGALPERLPAPQWSVDGSALNRSAGTRIDLGGIAKGWTCDAAVEQGFAAVVSAGGDVRSNDVETNVEIVDPWGTVAATIKLGAGALATSSTSRRRWRVGVQEANHLIDPRTMNPTNSPVLSATAITTTAVEAEAAAKAILVRGADGLAWADRQPWISAALVVWDDGNVYATSDLEIAA